eukprot:g41025.t1
MGDLLLFTNAQEGPGPLLAERLEPLRKEGFKVNPKKAQIGQREDIDLGIWTGIHPTGHVIYVDGSSTVKAGERLTRCGICCPQAGIGLAMKLPNTLNAQHAELVVVAYVVTHPAEFPTPYTICSDTVVMCNSCTEYLAIWSRCRYTSADGRAPGEVEGPYGVPEIDNREGMVFNGDKWVVLQQYLREFLQLAHEGPGVGHPRPETTWQKANRHTSRDAGRELPGRPMDLRPLIGRAKGAGPSALGHWVRADELPHRAGNFIQNGQALIRVSTGCRGETEQSLIYRVLMEGGVGEPLSEPQSIGCGKTEKGGLERLATAYNTGSSVLNSMNDVQLSLQIKISKDQLCKILGEKNAVVGAELRENQSMAVHQKEIITELERHAETVNSLIREDRNASKEGLRNE